jgi:NADPH:quinone reductase-like Zn-dependent oxidoreductase
LDGSHAELIAIPEAALSRKPSRLDHAQAASVGVTFVVGWLGLADYAALQKGEDVAIVGVSGGVGGAAAQLARALGATRVIGIDRHRLPETRPPPPALTPMWPPMETSRQQSGCTRAGMARMSSSMR